MLAECRYLLESFEWILIVCSKLISMQELMYHMLPLTVLGAVQLLRDALGGEGGHNVTLCDRGEESVARACNPEQVYIFPIREQLVLRQTS